MPRKYYRRKKTTKKPTLARQVAIIKKMVTTNAPELKYSWSYSSPTINNGPTAGIFPYRSISVGTSDLNNRIGDNISVKKFKCTGFLSLPATYQSSMFRAIAFIYKRNPDSITTSFPTIINLYLESSVMNTNQAVNAHMDWDNHASFSTLYDKTVAVTSMSDTLETKKPFTFQFSIPARYQQVEFSAGSVYPVRNELVVAFISDVDDGLSYVCNYRVSYTDA